MPCWNYVVKCSIVVLFCIPLINSLFLERRLVWLYSTSLILSNFWSLYSSWNSQSRAVFDEIWSFNFSLTWNFSHNFGTQVKKISKITKKLKKHNAQVVRQRFFSILLPIYFMTNFQSKLIAMEHKLPIRI